jgi:RNA polymerase sigma-70 factor, ECF subfamily
MTTRGGRQLMIQPIAESLDVHRATDDVLAQRAGHDLDAFGELYRRHVCDIFRFVKKRTKDEKVAEDLTAQVFFRALRSAGTFNGSGSYRSWIFRIARNCLATWHRTKHRDVVVRDLPEPVDPAPSPASNLIYEESRDVLWNAVAGLPTPQREAVVLRYVDECTIDEIADQTDRTPGAVRVLLHRARKRLRHVFEGRAE